MPLNNIFLLKYNSEISYFLRDFLIKCPGDFEAYIKDSPPSFLLPGFPSQTHILAASYRKIKSLQRTQDLDASRKLYEASCPGIYQETAHTVCNNAFTFCLSYAAISIAVWDVRPM